MRGGPRPQAHADLSERGQTLGVEVAERGAAGDRRAVLAGLPSSNNSRRRALVSPGSEHLRDRHLHPDHPRFDRRSQDGARAQSRRPHQQRRARGQRLGSDRSPADRRHHRRDSAGQPCRQHSPPDRGLHRLRRRPRYRLGVGRIHRRNANSVDLRRLHDLQLHDQYGPERQNLSDRGRSVSDQGSRDGRRLRGGVCKNRRGLDRVPVSDPARRHRRPKSALHPGGHVLARRRGDLGLPDPDDRRQSRRRRGENRRGGGNAAPLATCEVGAIG